MGFRDLSCDLAGGFIVRPDMRYYFRSGRCRPNPRTKNISVPPRHMTKSYIPDSNMISQHYRYKDTTSHTSGIQVPEIQYNSGRYMSEYRLQAVPSGKGKTHRAHVTRVQALRRGPLASRRQVFARAST